MANFVLIHSTGGNPEEVFYPWLRKQLEKKGHKVYAPLFPTPVGQTLENWMREFEPYWRHVDENSVLIGRSIGAPFVLRVLERSRAKVKAAFLIAGFCSGLEIKEFTPLISTFIGKPFDWDKIRDSCGRFFVYNSDNDRFVPLQKGRELARNLHTRVRLVKGVDHFFMEQFMQLLKDIEELGFR